MFYLSYVTFTQAVLRRGRAGILPGDAAPTVQRFSYIQTRPIVYQLQCLNDYVASEDPELAIISHLAFLIL